MALDRLRGRAAAAVRRVAAGSWVPPLALVAALAVGAAAAAARGWAPAADMALIELRVRDVPGDLPLVGAYSRFGWSHPGPLHFWALALPYRLGWSSSEALLVATMALHALAGVVAWALARRIDPRAGATVVVVVLVVLATTPAEFVGTPWNPYVALVGSVTMVVAGWATAERLPAGPVVAVVAGSLLVQAHVVTAPYVLAVAASAVALALWAHRGEDPPEVPWRAAALAAGVGALLWMPAILQQLLGDDGNLRAVLSGGDGGGGRAGVGAGAGLVSRMFGPWPAWAEPATTTEAIVDTSPALPVWLLVPVAGAVVAVRRCQWAHLRGLVVAGVAVAGAAASTALLDDGVLYYLVVGDRGVVAAAMAIGAAAVFSAVSVHRVTLVAAVLSVGLAGLVGAQQLTGENHLASFGPTVEELAAAVVDEAGPGAVVEVSSHPDRRANEVAEGMLLQLERSGVTVRAPALGDARVGPRRASAADPELTVQVAPPAARGELEAQGWRILDEYQPLDPETVARVGLLRSERVSVEREAANAVTDEERFLALVELRRLDDEVRALEDGAVPMLVAVR